MVESEGNYDTTFERSQNIPKSTLFFGKMLRSKIEQLFGTLKEK
jgi:hypothetical protein